LAEFTGERVVPGQVSEDLWNEHLARYAFALRLAPNKRVLELGCGMGYGAALLAAPARQVIALDNSAVTILEALARYDAPGLHFLIASASQLPFPDASFDLIVAFEVIEHLPDWPALLDQARRLLAPHGQFMVSTPNRLYYAKSRAESGPNPFHSHEFEYEEFRAELENRFPHVALFVQNHVQGFAFSPLGEHSPASMLLPAERPPADPQAAHFFLAVCALAPQTGAPAYFYLPATGNLLGEREHHISLLEDELAAKTRWLEDARREHSELVKAHRQLNAQMEERAAWVAKVEQEAAERLAWATAAETELATTRALVTSLQEELKTRAEWAFGLEEEIQRARSVVAGLNAELESHAAAFAGYEQQVAGLKDALEQAGQDARLAAEQHAEALAAVQAQLAAVQAQLEAKCQELARGVELLHAAEATVEERTRWAQELDARVAELQATLQTAGASRWVRLGNRLGMGPDLKRF
jgi:SAM-dependent methyltransferase